MKKQQRRTAQGFTIIEVVLVLAIAGLIFLMVFVALPGLQRSQRDTQRRNDYAMLSTSVTNYMANHNGKLPTDCGKSSSKFKSDQINDQVADDTGEKGADPDGLQYQLSCEELKTGSLDELDTYERDSKVGPEVKVLTYATCGEDGVPERANSKRSFVIYGQLESGTYCNASS